MDPTANEPPLLQPCPARVLVQTFTHLVQPDPEPKTRVRRDPYSARLMPMLHRISKHQWNHEFVPGFHRWYTYGDELGYNNRICFYLVDCGSSPNDDDVPIFCYKWTGETFEPMPELLQSKEVQDELKEFPFTPGSYERIQDHHIRHIVKRRLRRMQRIPDRELEYMKEHPEDMEWLEKKVKPRFWSDFLAQIESRPKEKEEERRLGITHGPPPNIKRKPTS
ncbi:hypothetical protein BGW36DRAFT_144683 [Talaromyces proteolyticus]|uniref:Uncharacterized protein n=1 Tax=Talaromyces proteolyticus TaxID=1131652 RepID=A0AAD4KW89_9EURO|nr:uncharacterized protein BGW36DRAFT_144683 [Talaromyces proteolyticus]KAH8698362.1 hypothetical protein BGW36DRAFT_144683 [Talaromyces proteolyticus]